MAATGKQLLYIPCNKLITVVSLWFVFLRLVYELHRNTSYFSQMTIRYVIVTDEYDYHLRFVSRVSLTYRVKSAHKLKLTDKQLLQWLFPILLIMVGVSSQQSAANTHQTA